MSDFLKPFFKIALPHDDVLQNTFSMSVFAADLWDAYKGTAPEEYSNPRVFFSRTYLTKGLNNLLDVVGRRILTGFGDPVIQLQTPFGGGKTHALIALMHKAKEEWRAKTVVLVGTVLDAKEDRLWEMVEEQLTGRVDLLKSQVTPGKEKLRRLLSDHQPLLVLMDETLEYLVKAAGVHIGETTLAAQTLAFMQELSEVVSSLPRAVLVYTLPSSALEHYDEQGERLFQQLQKVVGRVEKVFSPIEDEEVSMIIRRRLFKSVDEEGAQKVVNAFLDYLEQKELLKKLKIEPKDYRERFMRSYPFQPEVIDVLYHKWGSFPDFQRTRGVLRLLALVVHSLMNSNAPYISLGDFDLSNQDIRQELVKFAGQEFNSIVAQDISSPNSGSKKVDRELGPSNEPLKLGTRTATVIFMNSFSGSTERGAYTDEIVLSATTPYNEPSIVHEALSKLSTELFYLQARDGKFYFQNQPNINKIHINKMENISGTEVERYERELIEKQARNAQHFRMYVWEEKPENIDDTRNYKLIVLKNKDDAVIRSIVERKGLNLRLYKNTLFFLAPDEIERNILHNSIRKLLAWERILGDSTLNLRDEDVREIKRNMESARADVENTLTRVYRTLLVPSNASETGFDEHRLGTPVYGRGSTLDALVYSALVADNLLVESLDPSVVLTKFLSERDSVPFSEMLDTCYKTPGEVRLKDRAVLENAIRSGVSSGKFCVAREKDGRLQFADVPSDSFGFDQLFVVKKERCSILEGDEKVDGKPDLGIGREDTGSGLGSKPHTSGSAVPVDPVVSKGGNLRREIVFQRLRISKDNVADILRMTKSLLEYFDDVKISIRATGGGIPEEKVNEIYEQLKQMGIVVEEN